MNELKKLRLYNKLFSYGEIFTTTMIIISLIYFLYMLTIPSFMLFFTFVGILMLIEVKGIEFNKYFVKLTMEDFDNDPKNKNYFKRMK